MQKNLWISALLTTACAACTTNRSTESPPEVQSSSGDRALLIGVGDHAHDPFDLPGIKLDIEMMRDVVRSIGFEDGQIQVLVDRNVTVDNIRAAFTTFLSEAGPNDRVVVYYSGHGTSVPDVSGDEADGRDEAFVMSDAPSSRRGTEGLLLDDQMELLFAGLEAGDQTLFVDSCHSGTIFKSVLSPQSFGPDIKDAKAKFIKWADEAKTKGGPVAAPAPAKGPASDFVERPAQAGRKFRAMTAAADHEQSLATRSGSVFTIGLTETVQRARNKAQVLSMKQLYDGVNGFVKEKLTGPLEGKFHPQIFGEGLETPLWQQRASTKSAGPGVMRTRMEGLTLGSAAMTIQADKQTYRVGDKLKLTIDAPTDGYLNIVNVGPDDQAIILFPNTFDTDNRIERGRFTWPTPAMTFDIEAQPPAGEVLIVAILTQYPRNFLNESIATRKGAEANFETKDAFPAPSYRSFGVVRREKNAQAYGAQLILRIKQ